jgi:hypothetical protein
MVTRLAILGVLLAAALSGRAAHADVQDALDALKRGQPDDVAAYIDRQVGCSHWAGEAPYDAERAADIDQAMRDLNCRDLQQDEDRLRAKYADAPAVLRALDGSHDLGY